MNDFTISQLARETNVHIDTIRYYERLSLIAPPRRSENGYRHYNDNDAAQLHFIRNTQALGFTLKEIKQLLTLRNSEQDCCSAVQSLTQKKLVDIRQKIQRFKLIETQLQHYANNCSDIDKRSECPLLDALWPQHTSQKKGIKNKSTIS